MKENTRITMNYEIKCTTLIILNQGSASRWLIQIDLWHLIKIQLPIDLN